MKITEERSLLFSLAAVVAVVFVVVGYGLVFWFDRPGAAALSGQYVRSTVAALLGVAFCVSLLFFHIVAYRVVFRPLRRLAVRISSLKDPETRFPFSRSVSLPEVAAGLDTVVRRLCAEAWTAQAARAQIDAVILSMPEGVLVADKKRRIVVFNTALKKMLGVREETEGKKVIEVIRNIGVQETVESALALREGVFTREVMNQSPIGERVLLVHAAALMQNGWPEGAVLVFNDITDLRRMERARRDFVANISHELRTPLSSIRGYAETLLDGALEDADNASQFLEIIRSSSIRLADMVSEMLLFSRIESGEDKAAVHVPADVAGIVTRAVSIVRPKAGEKKTRLDVDLPEGRIDALMCDEHKITQALINLVDNAVKYTQDGGLVEVSVSADAGSVEFSVRDNGIGIAKAEQERIFERFYRVEKSRTAVGTGLGLAIVKHIVQQHAGTVTVESAPGQGSVFRLRLPMAGRA